MSESWIALAGLPGWGRDRDATGEDLASSLLPARISGS
jgi:hypothetical protein